MHNFLNEIFILYFNFLYSVSYHMRNAIFNITQISTLEIITIFYYYFLILLGLSIIYWISH